MYGTGNSTFPATRPSRSIWIDISIRYMYRPLKYRAFFVDMRFTGNTYFNRNFALNLRATLKVEVTKSYIWCIL